MYFLPPKSKTNYKLAFASFLDEESSRVACSLSKNNFKRKHPPWLPIGCRIWLCISACSIILFYINFSTTSICKHLCRLYNHVCVCNHTRKKPSPKTNANSITQNIYQNEPRICKTNYGTTSPWNCELCFCVRKS